MKSLVVNVVTAIGAIAIIGTGLVLWLRHYEASSNEFAIVEKYPSPNGKYSAVLYQRSGGGFVPVSWCNRGVVVANKDEPVPSTQDKAVQERVYESDCDNENKISWLSDSTLQIAFTGVNTPSGTSAYMKGSDGTGAVTVTFVIGAQPGVQADVHEKP